MDDARFWERKARRYDAKLPPKGPNFAARIERARKVFPPDGRVLDVGCATGEITLDLAPHCGRITGLDTAPTMIEIANRKAQDRGVTNANFEAKDPADPSFAPASFNAITCYSVFHLVDDYATMLRRFHELLKPGGHVLNETPCLGDWGPHWRVILGVVTGVGLVPRVRRIRRADLEAQFERVGFEVIDSAVYNPKSGQHCVLARKPA